jgi:hypothetical protein
MYYRAHFDGRGAEVHADDIAALRFLYLGPGGGDAATEDSDGDGTVDAADNCAAIPNEAQNDSDADGAGDLCDPCPLVHGGVCEPIAVSTMRARLAPAGDRLVWRGTIAFPAGTATPAARVLLVNATGVVVDAASGAVPGPRLAHRSLRYRSGDARITLRPRRAGGHRVRVVVRGLDLGNGNMPLVSASLQIGNSTFTGALSCARPRGRRVLCE